VKDPVCGMNVVPGQARGGTATHEGHEYWFCSARCHDKFIAEPSAYVVSEPAPVPKASATETVEWTCPMHPEIVRSAPGNCPICGMALEPRTPTLEDQNPELRDMTRRFWIAVALTAPLLVMTMAEMFGVSLAGRAVTWIQLVLATPVVVWAGAPFFERGRQSVVNRSLNMFTLIALGVGVAYGFSLVATFASGTLPTGLRTGVYYEP
jgi:Cu+-exporting ATPase